MSCLICLEEINEKIINEQCGCRLDCHDECFKLFLNKSNFYCPICRIPKKNINTNNNSFTVFNLVFKLPPPLAILTWFVLSFLFSIFIFPFVFIKEVYGNIPTVLSYFVTLNFVMDKIIFYPMVITHFGALVFQIIKNYHYN